MACGCGGRARQLRSTSSTERATPSGTLNLAAAVQAGSAVIHEVYRPDGTTTGRKFGSLISAQSYATRIGGDVKPAKG